MNAARAVIAWLSRGRTAVIGMPYLWLLVFFLLPFAIILKISLADPIIARPPFTPFRKRMPSSRRGERIATSDD